MRYQKNFRFSEMLRNRSETFQKKDRSPPCRPESIQDRRRIDARLHLHWRFEPWIHIGRGGVPETIFTSFSPLERCGFYRWEPCSDCTPRRHVQRSMIMNGHTLFLKNTLAKNRIEIFRKQNMAGLDPPAGLRPRTRRAKISFWKHK